MPRVNNSWKFKLFHLSYPNVPILDFRVSCNTLKMMPIFFVAVSSVQIPSVIFNVTCHEIIPTGIVVFIAVIICILIFTVCLEL